MWLQSVSGSRQLKKEDQVLFISKLDLQVTESRSYSMTAQAETKEKNNINNHDIRQAVQSDQEDTIVIEL